jgi:mannitol/fructose-specific phosphotransferase system IIA component (Ntr-type)
VLATSIALATYSTGVDWPSVDDEPVRLAILIAVGADAASDAHLTMIAQLSRKLMDDGLRQALLAARSAAEAVALLRGAVGGVVRATESETE